MLFLTAHQPALAPVAFFWGYSESVTTKLVVFQNVFHKQRVVWQLWLLAVFSSWSKESRQLSVGRSAAKRVYLRRLPSLLAVCLPSCFSGETPFQRNAVTQHNILTNLGIRSAVLRAGLKVCAVRMFPNDWKTVRFTQLKEAPASFHAVCLLLTCVCSAVPTSVFAPVSEHHNQNDEVYDCTAATNVYFCLSVSVSWQTDSLSTFVFDTLFIKITANWHVPRCLSFHCSSQQSCRWIRPHRTMILTYQNEMTPFMLLFGLPGAHIHKITPVHGSWLLFCLFNKYV